MRNMKKEAMKIFLAKPGSLFEFSDLQKLLGLDKGERKALKSALDSLEEEGKIHRFKNRKFGLMRSADMATGTLSIARKGYGFVRCDPPAPNAAPPPDVFIARKNLGGALHGDRVLVRLLNRDSERMNGRIAKVLARAQTEFVGQFQFDKKGGVVIPRNDKINRLINIPKLDFRNQLQNGLWVLARVLDFGDERHPMTGEIIDIVGKDDDRRIDILLVIRDYGVQPEFPEEVVAEAGALPEGVSADEAARREDFRGITTFTIDPETAKDFDDALSIERLANGMFRLGVHIADVSHYVQPDSFIDREAFERGTSIYPVDRVIPMLPERLSNNLCSLRPNEDRLTMSVVMEIDGVGKVHRAEFFNGIIRSRHRLNYTEVQAVFDRSDPWLCAHYAGIRDELTALKELNGILIKMREDKGALDLDVGEADVIFDSDGNVIDLRRLPRLASHRLVEQCMVLANEVVASKLFRQKVPSIYRIHEPPGQDKLHRLVPVLANFGVALPPKRAITPRILQEALRRIERLGEAGGILRRVILRAMMRAEYAPENKGHYGLGSSCYTHFTSPIRRYPDLIVHRMLKSVIAGEHKDEQFRKFWKERMPEIAQHATNREERAGNIENEATNILGLEYMRRFLGHELVGFVSGVTNFGLFVELKRYPIEGLIKISNLDGDKYEFEEETLTLKGKRKGQGFRLGDRLLVSIDHIDVMKQEMDLSFVDKI